MVSWRNSVLCMGIGVVSLFFTACASTSKTDDPNFLGNYPPRDLETIMGNTLDQRKGELTPKGFGFVFYPRANAVELNYRSGINSITINLMQENREAMLDAMQKYISDYQAGLLNEKSNKKRAYFGKTTVSMLWGLMAPTYYAQKVRLRFEYQLVTPEKPYFVIASATTQETYDNGTPKKDGANSPANRIALSPIQCKKMIEMLNQDALLAIVRQLDIEASAFDVPDDGAVDSGEKELF